MHKFTLCILITLAITGIKTKHLQKRAAAAGPTWQTKQIPYAFSNIIEFNFEQRHKIGIIYMKTFTFQCAQQVLSYSTLNLQR
jgi:hypothetical protein